MYVTDTHSLVFYVEQKLTRLGKDARRIFESADDGKTVVYIPAPVLWEVSRHLADGKFAFPVSFTQWCRAIDKSDGFELASLDWQDVDEARRLPFKDPFDCLIAGTAIHLGMPLITRDSTIRESGVVETLW